MLHFLENELSATIFEPERDSQICKGTFHFTLDLGKSYKEIYFSCPNKLCELLYKALEDWSDVEKSDGDREISEYAAEAIIDRIIKRYSLPDIEKDLQEELKKDICICPFNHSDYYAIEKIEDEML